MSSNDFLWQPYPDLTHFAKGINSALGPNKRAVQWAMPPGLWSIAVVPSDAHQHSTVAAGALTPATLGGGHHGHTGPEVRLRASQILLFKVHQSMVISFPTGFCWGEHKRPLLSWLQTPFEEKILFSQCTRVCCQKYLLYYINNSDYKLASNRIGICFWASSQTQM